MRAKGSQQPNATARKPHSRPRAHSDFSSLPSVRYHFFGGKGGVGKTTAACAAALHLLKHARAGERILLFSTDPAHSLSDSLGLKIGDRLIEVARRGPALLVAREMNAVNALATFKRKHRAVLAEIAARGTLLDETDIKELLDLSLPGLDEVMALFELSGFARDDTYRYIVVDTAPSGHTSRLLSLPEVFTHWTRALDSMAAKHRYMVARLMRSGRRRVDEVDLFLLDLAQRIERTREMLYDENKTAFTLVTIPEAMSVEETERYYSSLRREGLPVAGLIVNRIERARAGCQYCRARAAGQAGWLKRIRRDFKNLRLYQSPLQAGEVRGLPKLRNFARQVWESEEIGEGRSVGKVKSRNVSATAPLLKSKRKADLPRVEARRLLIFGGKGGVGKTTAAAATGIALAESDVTARILVFSADPAHSLSDSFGEPIGEFKEGVAKLDNLDAMEINPEARFAELKDRYRLWIDELFDSLTGNSRWEIKFDRDAMSELVTLAPPGIDEIVALSAIADLLDVNRYATIVLDTAPTGHLVRFLELPDVALSWVRVLLKLLLKYRAAVRLSGVGEELIGLSKSIKRVIALLTDKSACEFVGVAIPEQMSLAETVRLSGKLKRLKVPMSRLLINNAIPAEAARECDFCSARCRAQSKIIEAFRQELEPATKLLIAPQHLREIRGRAQLQAHFAQWQAIEHKRARTANAKRAQK